MKSQNISLASEPKAERPGLESAKPEVQQLRDERQMPGGRKNARKKCSVETCDRITEAKGLCRVHYMRKRIHGDPQVHILIRNGKRGPNNPKWRGGTIQDGHGRTLIYSPDHPNPSFGKAHVYRYRLVMEAHLGRYLLPSEIVHHKNGDHSDDRLENLEVMTQAQHAGKHMIERMAGRWSYNHDKCADCGTTERKHGGNGFCKRCFQRKKNK